MFTFMCFVAFLICEKNAQWPCVLKAPYEYIWMALIWLDMLGALTTLYAQWKNTFFIYEKFDLGFITQLFSIET